jgi:hypothetical protein
VTGCVNALWLPNALCSNAPPVVPVAGWPNADPEPKALAVDGDAPNDDEPPNALADGAVEKAPKAFVVAGGAAGAPNVDAELVDAGWPNVLCPNAPPVFPVTGCAKADEEPKALPVGAVLVPKDEPPKALVDGAVENAPKALVVGACGAPKADVVFVDAGTAPKALVLDAGGAKALVLVDEGAPKVPVVLVD